jgi:hypothetical protein
MEAGGNGQHGLEASKNLLFWLVRSSILVPEYYSAASGFNRSRKRGRRLLVNSA